MFETRRNCAKIDFGRKVSQLYLVVLILLDLKRAFIYDFCLAGRLGSISMDLVLISVLSIWEAESLYDVFALLFFFILKILFTIEWISR